MLMLLPINQAAQRRLSDKPKSLLVPEMLAVPRGSPEEEEWVKKEGETKAKTGVGSPKTTNFMFQDSQLTDWPASSRD